MGDDISFLRGYGSQAKREPCAVRVVVVVVDYSSNSLPGSVVADYSRNRLQQVVVVVATAAWFYCCSKRLPQT